MCVIIEADNGPMPLMTRVQVKSDADFPPVDNSRVFNVVAGENTDGSKMPSLGDTGSDTDDNEEELDMAAVYLAMPLHVQERNEKRIEALVDFVMHQESPVYFGLTRDEVKT